MFMIANTVGCVPLYTSFLTNQYQQAQQKQRKGSTRAGSIYISCKSTGSSVQNSSNWILSSTLHHVEQQANELSGPYKTDTKPQALYFCTPTASSVLHVTIQTSSKISQVHLLSASVGPMPAERREPWIIIIIINTIFLTDYYSHYFNPGSRLLGHYSVLNILYPAIRKNEHTHSGITSGACDALNINKGAIPQCTTELLQYILQL